MLFILEGLTFCFLKVQIRIYLKDILVKNHAFVFLIFEQAGAGLGPAL